MKLLNFLTKPVKSDPVIYISSAVLIIFSVYILNSLSPETFPKYYVYIIASILAFYTFSSIGFDIVKYFSRHLYIFSIVLLVLTLVIGQVTRGTVRWIPIAGFSFQASEVIRPFLILYIAGLVESCGEEIRQLFKTALLAIIPVILIAVQPSFGVAAITFIGLFSMLFLKYFKGKRAMLSVIIAILILPISWTLLKPYQKDRVLNFFHYQSDPRGSGYNTIQSIISIGSGGLFGRGFKKGFQTQLKYLPEKHTDFVFAGISEELGFVGSLSVLILLFLLYMRLLRTSEKSKDETFRYFTIASVIVFITATIINVGMNLGILPITGLPLPLVSAGGSSLLSTMITLGIVVGGEVEN